MEIVMADDGRIIGTGQALEMPAKIIGLRTVDGRLIADMEGLPSVDVTDWFADAPPKNGAN